jgi:hypothetical protein
MAAPMSSISATVLVLEITGGIFLVALYFGGMMVLAGKIQDALFDTKYEWLCVFAPWLFVVTTWAFGAAVIIAVAIKQ